MGLQGTLGLSDGPRVLGKGPEGWGQILLLQTLGQLAEPWAGLSQSLGLTASVWELSTKFSLETI